MKHRTLSFSIVLGIGLGLAWTLLGLLSGSPRVAQAQELLPLTLSARTEKAPVVQAAPGTLDVRIAASSDDAEEREAGWTNVTGDDLVLVDDGGNLQTVGLRFAGLPITPGQRIVNAYLQFEADAVDSFPIALTIEGQAADDASTFANGWHVISSRPRTAASVSWSPPAWPSPGEAGMAQRTPDLSAVIQEIVDRPGWASGNALALIITGEGRRVAESYDGDPAGAPLLHVELEVPRPPCRARINDDPTEYTTVQAAVDAAVAGDTVKVAGYCAGVHARPVPAGYPWPPAGGQLYQVLSIDKTITVQGGYTPTNWTVPDPLANPTTLDAEEGGRVILVSGAVNPTVSGLRLIRGNALGLGGRVYDHSGGGVYVLDASAVISGNQILSNFAECGAGLYLHHSPSTIAGNLVDANVAYYGGAGMGAGLYLFESPATVQDNTFTHGESNMGGGVYLYQSAARFTRNTLAENSVTYAGGGLFAYNGTAYVDGNTFLSNTAASNGGAGMLEQDGTQFEGNTVSGNRSSLGGGLSALQCTARIGDNTFENNVGDYGGGVHVSFGRTNVHDNLVLSNTATVEGGGLWISHETNTFPTVIRTNEILSNSAATVGGGLYMYQSNASLEDNLVVGNSAGSNGGGFYLQDSTSRLERNTLLGNAADQDGGGAALYLGEDTLVNNVIADNWSGIRGGGLYLSTCASELQHNTIARNSGGTGGGSGAGIHIVAYPSCTGVFTIANSILVSHTTGIIVESGKTAQLDGTLWGSGAWANGTDSDGLGAIDVGTTNVWGDPAFLDPDGGDYHIDVSSAALDAGIDAGVTTDVDGDPRPMAGGYDIGADEACVPFTWVVDSTADSGPGTLRWALENAACGARVEFDPAVFDPGAPATITVLTPLPPLDDGHVTLDGSDAGVIVDGSDAGSIPELLLVDDVRLTLNGGPNLLVNGDFSGGQGHWRGWDEDGPGATRAVQDGALAWTTIAPLYYSRTVYDTTGDDTDWTESPWSSGSTAWIPVSGGGTAEVRLNYRYARAGVELRALFADGHTAYLGGTQFFSEDDWTEKVKTWSLPGDAIAVSLSLFHVSSACWEPGLRVTSGYNVVSGVQIVGFYGEGLWLGNGAVHNRIGGDRAAGGGPLGQGNLISGNAENGIRADGFPADHNLIQGNYIGTDVSGTVAWPNAKIGIILSGGAPHTTIGGASPTEGNLISANGMSGILLSNTTSNTIAGNLIGTDAGGSSALGNALYGISLQGGASLNLVGGSAPGAGNVIAYNGRDGVRVASADTLYNTLSRNSIHDNADKGISLDYGGNGHLPAPLLDAYDHAAGTISGTTCANCIVEVFSDDDGEGRLYEGQVVADGAGQFAFAKGGAFAGPSVTTTTTDPQGNTSEFSFPAPLVVARSVPQGSTPWIEFGDTGLSMICSYGPGGTVTVTRHPVPYADPPAGVGVLSTYWEISSTFDAPFECALFFYYDENDLNGTPEQEIAGAARWDPTNARWEYQGGALYPEANLLIVNPVTAFSPWLLVASTPPRAPADLGGARAGADLELTWSAVTEDLLGNALTPDHYVVYRRANEPYFAPTPSDVVATPATPGFTDPGVLGDPASNYYYVITAVDALGTESAPSIRLGAFTQALVPAGQAGQRSYNLIAVNLDVPGVVNADTLAAYVGPGVYMVLRHEAATQEIVWRLPGLAGTNFAVEVGDAVYLYLDESAPEVLSLVGAVPPIGAVGFGLTAAAPGASCAYNFISVPLDRDGLLDADALAADIGGVYSVSRWNAATQDLTWRMPGGPGENFPVRAGYPYIVCLDETAPPNWP